MQQDEIRYRLLKLIEEDPSLDQRGLAKAMGVSLGSTNYCLKALVERGYVKAGNFRKSENKRAYLYVLTPEGVDERLNTAKLFLIAKKLEYERLREEIQSLSKELEEMS